MPLLRLRTVLFLLGLVVLLLPVGALRALRIYETEVIRQTESELLAQGALLVAVWRSTLLATPAGGEDARLNRMFIAAPADGTSAPSFSDEISVQPALDPLTVQLDLARENIRPPAEDALVTPFARNPASFVAGSEMTPLIREGVRRTLAGVRVLDAQGIVVASSGGELGLWLGLREEVQRALAGEEVSLIRERITDNPDPAYGSPSRRTGIRLFVALPVMQQGRVLGAVVLSRTPDSARDALWRSRNNIAVSALVLIVIVVAMATFAAMYVNQPIRDLIAQADRVASGRPAGTVTLPDPRLVEVQQLSQSIAKMASTLESRAEYIRQFASHVSHEFKTPLTTITGSVEMLRDARDASASKESTRLLDLIRDDSARLSNLVRRLLDLARADTAATQQTGACDPMRIARAVAGRLETPDARISVNGSGVDALRVSMDESSMTSILENLITNGIQHGGGSVDVSLSVGDGTDRSRWVSIEVSDAGPGISDANQARIFDPFFTTARARGGTGLGLSIVKSLVESHGGTLSLASSPKGSRFTVTLPVVVG